MVRMSLVCFFIKIRKIEDFKVDQNNNFCKSSALNDRLCLEVMFMVRF